MSDTARDIQPPELVSTVGLEELFEADANPSLVDAPEVELVREMGANGSVGGRELDANPSPVDAPEVEFVREVGASGSADVRELDGYVTVEDAAALIGISVRAVQKRLKRGTLNGMKTRHGSAERWLVEVSSLPVTKADASIEPGAINDDEMDAPIIELVRETGANVPVEVREPDASTASGSQEDYRDKLIKDLQSQLQAASWRNGYLESKLEERDNQIK